MHVSKSVIKWIARYIDKFEILRIYLFRLELFIECLVFNKMPKPKFMR